jgi:proteasome accessory factor B
MTVPLLSRTMQAIVSGPGPGRYHRHRMHPLERLINLVALLLESRHPVTFEEIRRVLPAYQQDDRGSAKRQFERDKDLLRTVGIPVEMAPTDVWGVEEGYRIPKERYYLPEISFTPEEVAALFVAAHSPGEDAEAAQAFHKLALQAESGALSTLAEAPPTSGIDSSGPHLAAVADSVARRRRLRFRYRSVQGRTGEREVDAWGLVFRRGAWYLVGKDRRRGEPRSFRLSRILSEVRDAGPAESPPDGFLVGEHLAAGPWGFGEPEAMARVSFSPKIAWWATSGVPGAKVARTRRDGWIETEVPAARSDSFVSWILSFGPDAKVISPKSLREAVVARLKAVHAAL